MLKDAGDDMHQAIGRLHGRRVAQLAKRANLLFKPLPHGLEHSTRKERFDAISQALLHCGKIALHDLRDDLLSDIHLALS